MIFVRGNPDNRGETFERQWLAFSAGGKFEEGKSPRLSLAEKIADPANPLTARVIVNRVWAWHFGSALADPGDFGMQQSDPPLRPLLDWLAVRFNEQGGSLKSLHRLILTSQAFRLAADGPRVNLAVDEANTLLLALEPAAHGFRGRCATDCCGTPDHWKPRHRRALGVVGSAAADRPPQRVCLRGSLRAVQYFRFASTCRTPTITAPKRVETTVPQQALYFLNGPLRFARAAKLAGRCGFQSAAG